MKRTQTPGQLSIFDLLHDAEEVGPSGPKKSMTVLVACEESQAVTIELRKHGHRAFSCDIIDPSGGHPEWHIKQDVLPLLNGRCTFKTTDGKTHIIPGRWDAIIAFPPCTHLAVSGARHFAVKRMDGRQREGVEFFCHFLVADCEIIIIENPVGIISGDYVKEHFPDLAEKYGLPLKPTQIIQPWMFGDNAQKSTCIWIKGTSPLIAEITEEPELEYFEWMCNKTGKMKRQPMWYYRTRCLPAAQRGAAASKTFPGIARALAELIDREAQKAQVSRARFKKAAIKEADNMKVYKGIGPNEGKIVPEVIAFPYACIECGITNYNPRAPEFGEFREMLVEWYFSGDWIKEDFDG